MSFSRTIGLVFRIERLMNNGIGKKKVMTILFTVSQKQLDSILCLFASSILASDVLNDFVVFLQYSDS